MAIHSPHTGIVDYTKVTESYAEEIKERKGTIYTGYEVRYCLEIIIINLKF